MGGREGKRSPDRVMGKLSFFFCGVNGITRPHTANLWRAARAEVRTGGKGEEAAASGGRKAKVKSQPPLVARVKGTRAKLNAYTHVFLLVILVFRCFSEMNNFFGMHCSFEVALCLFAWNITLQIYENTKAGLFCWTLSWLTAD